jgi:TatD DNase family protein
MHCFSGDAAFARECLDRGAWLSFAGTVTFKNAAPLREALAVTPLDRILVETDAPYLTPTPYRGRPNASYLVPHTVRAMAEQLEIDLVELCRAVDRNTERAFGGGW